MCPFITTQLTVVSFERVLKSVLAQVVCGFSITGVFLPCRATADV